MEIKSSLLNSKELKLLKDSLIAASEVDGKENFRVRLIEYIDDTADNEEDEFFYDMIEFCRFLKPDPETTAYTTPEHLIYLNAPGVFGEKIREWDFVYCHECLHQLWETFDVAEQIKKNGVKYDHYVLNVASDCVINDYLSAIRKKTAPPDGITPEYLQETYGIDYDRKVDTQYTLYLKLLEVAEKLRKDQRCQDAQDGAGQSGEGQEGQGNGSSSSSSSSSSSNSSSGDGSSSDKKDSQNKTASDAQKSADEAKKAADKAQDNADSGKGSQEDADAAKEAAKEAQDAADRAKEAADKGDKEGEAKAAQEAKDAADKAKELAGEGSGDGKDGEGSGGGKDGEGKDKDGAEDKGGNKSKGGEGGDAESSSKGQGHGDSGPDKGISGEMTEEQKEQIKAKAEDVIKKYKEKISGAFGDFVKKCKNSVKCDPNGLANNTKKGKGAWNKQMDLAINAYVKKNLDKKRRQFEQTYKRVKRGSGIVKMGAPIIPGKRIKDDKMPINIAYYIDISGSMGGCIDKVFEAAFKISEALKQRFRKDKLVKSTDFRTFVFNDRMKEIKFGQTTHAWGSTMDFDEILEFISKNTKNVLINIIITDANFNVNETEVKDFLKKGVDGLVIFITNCENNEVKKIANENEFKTKLVYILADANFNVE